MFVLVMEAPGSNRAFQYITYEQITEKARHLKRLFGWKIAEAFEERPYKFMYRHRKSGRMFLDINRVRRPLKDLAPEPDVKRTETPWGKCHRCGEDVSDDHQYFVKARKENDQERRYRIRVCEGCVWPHLLEDQVLDHPNIELLKPYPLPL
jgi:hypothetical protein